MHKVRLILFLVAVVFGFLGVFLVFYPETGQISWVEMMHRYALFESTGPFFLGSSLGLLLFLHLMWPIVEQEDNSSV